MVTGKLKGRIGRVSLITFCLTLSLGFRLISERKWFISEGDPTLWIKFCGNDLESVRVLMLEVIADINAVETSYLRVALYPADPDNPGDPEEGDSVFTKAKAENRTIEICFEAPGSLGAAGDSSQILDGNSIVGCKIRLGDKLRSAEANTFKGTIAHELGHCFGLDHPQDTDEALMSYFDDDAVGFLIDDKMGLSHLYPKTMDGVSYREKPTLGMSCTAN